VVGLFVCMGPVGSRIYNCTLAVCFFVIPRHAQQLRVGKKGVVCLFLKIREHFSGSEAFLGLAVYVCVCVCVCVVWVY